MELSQLTYFFHTAKLGSISAASAVLGVAQPAISRQIAKLEQDLGSVLLVRHGRGVRLTEAGLSVLVRTERIFAEAEEMRQEVAALSKLPSGDVSVAVTEIIAPLLVPSLLRKLRTDYPLIRLLVMQALSDEVRKAVITRRVDVGVFYCSKPSTSLTIESLHADPLVVIGRRGSVLQRCTEIEFRQIAALPLILPPRGHEMRKQVEAAAEVAGVTLNVAYEVDTMSVVKQMILTEGNFSIMPMLGASAETPSECLCWVPICNPSLVRPLIVATLPSGLSQACRIVGRLARQLWIAPVM